MCNNKLFTLLLFTALIVTNCKAQTNPTLKDTFMTDSKLITQLMPKYYSLIRYDPVDIKQLISKYDSLMRYDQADMEEVDELLHENKINEILLHEIVKKVAQLNTKKSNETNGVIEQLMHLKEVKETEIISNNKRLLHIEEENDQNKNNP